MENYVIIASEHKTNKGKRGKRMNTLIKVFLWCYLLWGIATTDKIRNEKISKIFRIIVAIIAVCFSIKVGSKLLIGIFALHLISELLDMKMDFDINRKKKKEEEGRKMYEEEQIRQENVKEGVVYTLSEDEYQELE